MGNNNNTKMLRSVEETAVSSDTSPETPGKQHESNMHRLADGSKIFTRNLATLEKYFSSMEGKGKVIDVCFDDCAI